MVPVGVDELDVAHAALDQPARQQAVGAERRLARLDAVEVERLLRFAGEVHDFGGGGLHAERGFVGGDARLDFGIAGRAADACRFRSRTASMNCACCCGVDAGRVLQIEDRLRPAQERRASIERGQKAARPDRRAAARPARPRLQDDERRQALRFAADALGDPRAHRRPAELRRAGVEEHLGGPVVEDIGLHPLEQANVIDDIAMVAATAR